MTVCSLMPGGACVTAVGVEQIIRKCKLDFVGMLGSRMAGHW